MVGEGIREPGDLILNRSCIGGLGENNCSPGEGRAVLGSIEDEDPRYDFLDSLVGEIRKCERVS